MYGYSDTNEGGDYGKFGLNTGARLAKFEFNPNGGKDGAALEVVDIVFMVGTKEYRQRYFPITKVYYEGKDAQGNQLQGEITDQSSEAYKKAAARDAERLGKILISIVSCYVAKEEIKAALAQPIRDFRTYIQILERLVKSEPNWQEIELDLFLQYQWQPSPGKDKTYLEVPCTRAKLKHINQGLFVVPSVEGGPWSLDVSKASINYINAEGKVHPIKRSEWFANSNYASATVETTTTIPSGTSDLPFSDTTETGATPAGW